MSVARPFAYNTGAPIPGTEQVGSLAVGIPTNGFASTGIAEWWNGPDEALGYVIAEAVPGDTQPTPVPPVTASVGFFRSDALTEASFVSLTNGLFNQNFTTGDQCRSYLNTNGYWTSWGLATLGLTIQLDANNSSSYPGAGTTVYDITGSYNHTLTNAPYTLLSGVKCFDVNGSTSNVRVNSPGGPILPTDGYTYISWARIKASSGNYRTLFRTTPNDHPILTNVGTDDLGFYDNDSNQFIGSGYSVTSIKDVWVQYAVVGDSSSSVFYINGNQVGTTPYGAGGNYHDYWGSIDSQAFGYVANMYFYNRKLYPFEIVQQYNYLSPRFSGGGGGTTVGNFTLLNAYSPAGSNGSITFPGSDGSQSNNPNTVGLNPGNGIYINKYNLAGTDESSVLDLLVGRSGTLTLTQGSNSVTYSFTNTAFNYTSGSPYANQYWWDNFHNGASSPLGTLTVTSSSPSNFNYTDTITITVS